MDRDGVEVCKHAKKERGQYPATLTKQTYMAFGEIFIIAGYAGLSRAWVANHNSGFGSTCPFAELAI